MGETARIQVSGALEGEFIVVEQRSPSEFVIRRDTSWAAMLGNDERDATEIEIAALEAENGPILPPDDEARQRARLADERCVTAGGFAGPRRTVSE